MSDNSGGGQGCGCVPFVLLVFVLWALVIGLPTPWGTLDLDLIPPGIYLTK